MVTPTGAIIAGAKIHTAKSKNQNDWVIIQCAGIEIVADMPEEVTTAVGSEWESRLPSALPGVADIAAKTFLGSSPQIAAATQQVWVNSSPVEIPISLAFDAVTDAFEEVVKPARILESLAMPRYANGFLFAPGPSIAGSGEDYGCELRIGRQFNQRGMILTSAQVSMSSRLEERGYPIAARVDCTFRTPRVMTNEEWLIATGVASALSAAFLDNGVPNSL